MPKYPARAMQGQQRQANLETGPEVRRATLAPPHAVFGQGAIPTTPEFDPRAREATLPSYRPFCTKQVGLVQRILSPHLAERISPWPTPGTIVPDWEKRVAAAFREFTRKNLRTWLPLLGLLEQLLPIGVIRGTAVRRLAKRYVRRLSQLRFVQLPDHPRFVFCATDMVFGVNWVFDSEIGALGKGRFGDYQAGYLHPAPPRFVGRAVARRLASRRSSRQSLSVSVLSSSRIGATVGTTGKSSSVKSSSVTAESMTTSVSSRYGRIIPL
jgi:hypothetical protein